jgi:hypothetical protein
MHLVWILVSGYSVNSTLTFCSCYKLHLIRIFIHKTVDHIDLLQSQLHWVKVLWPTWDICWPELLKWNQQHFNEHELKVWNDVSDYKYSMWLLPVHQPCLVLIDASLYGTTHFVTMVLADVNPLRSGNRAVGCARIYVCSMVNHCVYMREKMKNLYEWSHYTASPPNMELTNLIRYSCFDFHHQPLNTKSRKWKIIRKH